MAQQETTSDASQSERVQSMLGPSLYRLTAGLPRRELKQIIAEAKACEAALENEMDALEHAETHKAAVDVMLSTELTSADRYYTVSALMGRLREPLATPHPPNSSLPQAVQDSRKATTTALEEKQQALLDLEKHFDYTKKQESSSLLSVWKKISSHRTAAVFRRPVNTREAPGYTDRIQFPMDLSLIRKMITAGMITSYAELHQKVGLICHNCVKYNGRESDYGIVTREFEAHVDECLLAAVSSNQTTTPTEKQSEPPSQTARESKPTDEKAN